MQVAWRPSIARRSSSKAIAREVALKRLLPQLAADKRFVEDFIREGKLSAQLQHPNIVRTLEVGRIGRTYFIAMDLVRGQPLMSLMRKAYTSARPHRSAS